MTELTPFSYGAHEVRTILVDGEPWFVAADVCAVLEIVNARQAVARVDGDDACQVDVIDSLGRSQKAYAVNESGLYELIIRSDKPQARPFRRWVTAEVLPAIRKTGGYGVATFDPRNLDHVAQLAATAAEQARQIEAARPAVEFVQNFVSGEGTYLVREVAAVLGVRAMGQNNLFDYLRRKRVLIGDGESKNLPYREQIEAGRFEVKVATRDNSRTGQPVGVRTVRVTPKGLDYIRRLLTDDGFTCTGSVAC